MSSEWEEGIPSVAMEKIEDFKKQFTQYLFAHLPDGKKYKDLESIPELKDLFVMMKFYSEEKYEQKFEYQSIHKNNAENKKLFKDRSVLPYPEDVVK